jgi:hypothetical protein
VGLIFLQHCFNRLIVRPRRLQHRSPWHILNAERFEHVEITVDEVRARSFSGGWRFEVGEKVE